MAKTNNKTSTSDRRQKGKPYTTPRSKKVSVRRAKVLQLDMIKDDDPAASVAKYIFKPLARTGMTNSELAKKLGYPSHSNISMMRSGQQRLPIKKAGVLAEVAEMNEHALGIKVLENNLPEEYLVLKSMGVIASKRERDFFNELSEIVPTGAQREFLEKIIEQAKEEHGK